jgi:hypothetical protein
MFIGARRSLLSAKKSGLVPSAQAAAFLARTSGLSATEQNAYIRLINGLVADGDFSKLDVLYIFGTNSRTTAKLNLISTNFAATENGTVSFAADQGYTGDASTFYLDTGFNPTTAPSPNFTTANASLGVYQLNSRTADQTWCQIGSNLVGGNNKSDIFTKFSGGAFGQFGNGGGASATVANGQGLTIATRNGTTSAALFRNGVSVATDTPTSDGPASIDLSVFALNVQSGSPSFFCGDQLSAAFIGGSINAANVSARLNRYMTDIGINVY